MVLPAAPRMSVVVAAAIVAWASRIDFPDMVRVPDRIWVFVHVFASAKPGRSISLLLVSVSFGIAKFVALKIPYSTALNPESRNQELFYTSGHLPYYKDDMYAPMKMDNETYYLKPMNCPLMHMI